MSAPYHRDIGNCPVVDAGTTLEGMDTGPTQLLRNQGKDVEPVIAPDVLQPAAMYAFSNDGPGEWWWLWRIMMFLVWIVVITLVVRWVLRGRYHQPSPLDQARGILAERYARGEINDEEYRQRSEQLK